MSCNSNSSTAIPSVATNGTNGTNGATWLTGSGIPSGSTGVVNDLYLNTTNGNYYKKTGTSTWTLQGSLIGATGSAGTNGTNNVTVLYNNTTASSAINGATTTLMSYPLAVGTVTANGNIFTIDTNMTSVPQSGYNRVFVLSIGGTTVASFSEDTLTWTRFKISITASRKSATTIFVEAKVDTMNGSNYIVMKTTHVTGTYTINNMDSGATNTILLTGATGGTTDSVTANQMTIKLFNQ